MLGRWQPSQLPSQPPGSARSVLFTGGLPLPNLWGAPTPLRDLLDRGPPSSPEGVRSQASSLSCRTGGPPHPPRRPLIPSFGPFPRVLSLSPRHNWFLPLPAAHFLLLGLEGDWKPFPAPFPFCDLGEGGYLMLL